MEREGPGAMQEGSRMTPTTPNTTTTTQQEAGGGSNEELKETKNKGEN